MTTKVDRAEKRGEVGGVHAKMEEVRVWHAQQRMLCGGDDLGTKGVYYMYMRRDDITLVARGGANGRQKSVVLSRSDKKVLYRVRPPTTAEARKESSRLLKEEEDIYGVVTSFSQLFTTDLGHGLEIADTLVPVF